MPYAIEQATKWWYDKLIASPRDIRGGFQLCSNMSACNNGHVFITDLLVSIAELPETPLKFSNVTYLHVQGAILVKAMKAAGFNVQYDNIITHCYNSSTCLFDNGQIHIDEDKNRYTHDQKIIKADGEPEDISTQELDISKCPLVIATAPGLHLYKTPSNDGFAYRYRSRNPIMKPFNHADQNDWRTAITNYSKLNPLLQPLVSDLFPVKLYYEPHPNNEYSCRTSPMRVFTLQKRLLLGFGENSMYGNPGDWMLINEKTGQKSLISKEIAKLHEIDFYAAFADGRLQTGHKLFPGDNLSDIDTPHSGSHTKNIASGISTTPKLSRI